MTHKVTKHTTGPYSGLWVAQDDAGNVIATSETNAGMWRKLDWINAEADNPQQAKIEWSFSKAASGE